MQAKSERITDKGKRPATHLHNGSLQVVIDDKGGIVSELSYPRGERYVNAHWIPHFRGNSGKPYNPEDDAEFWGGELLYELGGNFLCSPNFGQPGRAHGVDWQPHAFTSTQMWKFRDNVQSPEGSCAISTAKSPYQKVPLAYTKYDILLSDQSVFYTAVKIENQADEALEINIAWHNNLGAPFLGKGAVIDCSARQFATVPSPNEFDATGRLAPGKEFDSLEKAPLRNGGITNCKTVPGPIGYTDFATGAIPKECETAYSSLVNPGLHAAYVSFFRGPSSGDSKELHLYFNDFWMQYGGRNFTPWAAYQGGTDLSYCLGAENAVGAYANGLEYSLSHPNLLGNPTTEKIPPHAHKILYYATALFEYPGDILDSGIHTIHPETGHLTLENPQGNGHRIKADCDFSIVKKMIAQCE